MNHYVLVLCLQCLLLLSSVQGRLGFAPQGGATTHLHRETVMAKANQKITPAKGEIARIAALRGGVEKSQPKKVMVCFIAMHNSSLLRKV